MFGMRSSPEHLKSVGITGWYGTLALKFHNFNQGAATVAAPCFNCQRNFQVPDFFTPPGTSCDPTYVNHKKNRVVKNNQNGTKRP